MSSTRCEDLPVCLDGDRLEFMAYCRPRIQITPAMTLEAFEPAGASWDGASIPRPFLGIFGHPLEADFRLASYWHDRLCEAATCIEDRTIADAVFLRLLMWSAVRLYGVFIWRA